MATVGADLASPAGFALRTGKPVISNHLENEQRFSTPDLLIRHGIRRAMNVILQGDGSPFGVLEVDIAACVQARSAALTVTAYPGIGLCAAAVRVRAWEQLRHGLLTWSRAYKC